MKSTARLLLALGALTLLGCVSNDSTVQTARPGDPVKRNTFDDLRPRPNTGGFERAMPNAPDSRP